MIGCYKENLEEHNANAEHLEYHAKESLINLYEDLLKLANALMEEVAE